MDALCPSAHRPIVPIVIIVARVISLLFTQAVLLVTVLEKKESVDDHSGADTSKIPFIRSMAAKQRSKKDKADEVPASETSVSDETLEQQLDRAEIAVRKAKDATAYLQDQWRNHLFRLSFLVLLVSFNQSRTPMQECMNNIKVWKYVGGIDGGVLFTGVVPESFIR